MPLGGLMTAGLIVGGVTGLAQTGLGIADRVKGSRKLKEAQSFYEKNKYKIPESAKAALGVAERQASGLRMPGEDIARERMGQVTGQAVGQAKQAATSSSDVLGVLASVFGNQMLGEQDIVMQGARRYDTMQNQLQGALGQMAQYEDQKWQYNVLYPYNQMLGQAEAYQTRGTQEIGMGMSAFGSTAAGAVQVASAQNQYDAMMQQYGLTPPQNQYWGNVMNQPSRQGLPSNNMGYQQPTLNINYNHQPLGG